MRAAMKLMANLNIMIGLALMLAPFAFLIIINTPEVWYRINPNAVEDEVVALTRDPFAVSLTNRLVPDNLLPDPGINQTLPKENRVSIPKIGVNTKVREGKNEREILAKGVWLMPGYGTPASNDQPIILAAHRWGPNYITPDYRSQHMFYNLPQLKPGDRISVTWEQREYWYEVRKKETKDYVGELSDLILITCQYYNSDQRIIIYADRVT